MSNNERHVLTNVDVENRTATCAVCGPNVRVRKNGKRFRCEQRPPRQCPICHQMLHGFDLCEKVDCKMRQLALRAQEHIKQEGGHMLWQRRLSGGSPTISYANKGVRVRQVMWYAAHGECLDRQRFLVAECGERRCVNPEHLRVETKAEAANKTRRNTNRALKIRSVILPTEPLFRYLDNLDLDRLPGERRENIVRARSSLAGRSTMRLSTADVLCCNWLHVHPLLIWDWDDYFRGVPDEDLPEPGAKTVYANRRERCDQGHPIEDRGTGRRCYECKRLKRKAYA